MKTIFTLILFLLSISFIFSQKKAKNENGKVVNGIYNCYRFPWRIKIPEKYFIIEEKLLKELEKSGNDIAKKNLPENVKIQNREHLIGFQLNNQNTFSASFNLLDKTKKITLNEHEKFITELLKKTCSKIENAIFEFKSYKVKIKNYQFYKIKVEGYNKSNGKLMITQIYYNSFIKEHLFGVLITFNDKNEGKLLENNFLSSFNK